MITVNLQTDKGQVNGTIESISELKKTEYGQEYYSVDIIVAVKKEDIEVLK